MTTKRKKNQPGLPRQTPRQTIVTGGRAVVKTQPRTLVGKLDALAIEAPTPKKKASGWVELFPYGVSFGLGGLRPVLILKSEDSKTILPVWMNPVDAGMAMADSNVSRVQHTPHKLSLHIMQKFGLNVKECRFVGIQGHHQLAELRVEGESQCQVISVRASEAMSFCLNAKARFFASKDVIMASRDLSEEVGPVNRAQTPTTKKNTSYLM